MGKIDNLRNLRGTYEELGHESLMVTEENPRIVHLDGVAAGSICPKGEWEPNSVVKCHELENTLYPRLVR